MYEAIVNYTRKRINGCLIGTKIDVCADMVRSDIDRQDDGTTKFIVKFSYNAFAGDNIQYTVYGLDGKIEIKIMMVLDSHLEQFYIRVFEYVEGEDEAYTYDLRDGKRVLNIDADHNHVEMA